MTKFLAFLPTISKFLAAAGGAVAIAISLGLLTGDAQKYVTGGLAIATAFVVYLVKNSTAPVVVAAAAVPKAPEAPAA